MSTSISESDFITQESNRLNMKKQNVDTAVAAQHRLTELNDSYRKRYAKYVEIFVVLIFIFLAYLAINMLQEKVPQIPGVVFDGLFLGLLLILAFYLWFAFVELSSRSRTDYDEIDIPPVDDPNLQVDIDTLLKKGQITDAIAGNANCVGAACCSKTNPWNTETSTCGFTTMDQAFSSDLITMPKFSQTIQAVQDSTKLSYVAL